MKVPTLRRQRHEELPGVTGVARVGRRTKDLLKKLRAGDIAVIDHIDIDRATADALVACGVAAVVNASPSISGRYPNMGPELILEAGIPLLDGVGESVLASVDDVDGDALYAGERLVATGVAQDESTLQQQLADAQSGLSVQMEAFSANTMEFLKRERELLLEGVGIPRIKTRLRGRHCLVVTKGFHYRADLKALRRYIREYRPVLIGVDDGADALLEAGHSVDVIVGDLDTVSDRALRTASTVVARAHRDGRVTGMGKAEEHGIEPTVFAASGTSEDLAMLLADEMGASLIVAVGSHQTLLEFLDKGRAGMASTFLTRLRIGGKLVDAKAVSRLHRSRITGSALLALVVACLVTMIVAAVISPIGGVLGMALHDLWTLLTT